MSYIPGSGCALIVAVRAHVWVRLCERKSTMSQVFMGVGSILCYKSPIVYLCLSPVLGSCESSYHWIFLAFANCVS